MKKNKLIEKIGDLKHGASCKMDIDCIDPYSCLPKYNGHCCKKWIYGCTACDSSGNCSKCNDVKCLVNGICKNKINGSCNSYNKEIKTETTDKEINHALSNSFGFGGTNASLVISKY